MGGLLGGLGAKNEFHADNYTNEQLNQQYGNMQGGLAQQQAFLQALQAQGGIGNQNLAFQNAQNLANGVGPNPAQQQLAQATAANTANQAALMAGQRGTSANTGLLARQASMQGAQNQQNAAGQAATMQAQQQLAAQQQMAQIAAQQVAQQQGATNAYQQGTAGAYGQLSNNINNQNAVNAGVAQQNTAASGNLVGNLMGAAGTAAGMYFGGPAGAAVGSEIGQSIGGRQKGSPRMMADGGVVDTLVNTVKSAFEEEPKKPSHPIKPPDPVKTKGFIAGGNFSEGGPVSNVGKHFHGIQKAVPMMADGGKVPAMVSPGEKYLKPQDVEKVEAGANPMEVGEKIPGKAKVKGAKNSYANDIVPKTLDEGGIVLPRSVTQSKNPHWEAKKFVEAILVKQGKGLPKK